MSTNRAGPRTGRIETTRGHRYPELPKQLSRRRLDAARPCRGEIENDAGLLRDLRNLDASTAEGGGAPSIHLDWRRRWESIDLLSSLLSTDRDRARARRQSLSQLSDWNGSYIMPADVRRGGRVTVLRVNGSSLRGIECGSASAAALQRQAATNPNALPTTKPPTVNPISIFYSLALGQSDQISAPTITHVTASITHPAIAVSVACDDSISAALRDGFVNEVGSERGAGAHAGRRVGSHLGGHLYGGVGLGQSFPQQRDQRLGGERAVRRHAEVEAGAGGNSPG